MWEDDQPRRRIGAQGALWMARGTLSALLLLPVLLFVEFRTSRSPDDGLHGEFADASINLQPQHAVYSGVPVGPQQAALASQFLSSGTESAGKSGAGTQAVAISRDLDAGPSSDRDGGASIVASRDEAAPARDSKAPVDRRAMVAPEADGSSGSAGRARDHREASGAQPKRQAATGSRSSSYKRSRHTARYPNGIVTRSIRRVARSTKRVLTRLF